MTAATATQADKRDKLINAFRETLRPLNWWQHNEITRRLDRLLAEYDGTLAEYLRREKQERDREARDIAEQRRKLDDWERRHNERYATTPALPGDADADCVAAGGSRDGVPAVQSS